jgi:hypothetical protein
MHNHTHSDLERLKAQAKMDKLRKKVAESMDTSNPDNVQPSDVLIILHADEANILEDVILDVLSGEPLELSREQKQLLVGFIKHLQGGE